ncbi:hypothetical protein FRC05_002307, partial [Tulasnella sp. 425]
MLDNRLGQLRIGGGWQAFRSACWKWGRGSTRGRPLLVERPVAALEVVGNAALGGISRCRGWSFEFRLPIEEFQQSDVSTFDRFREELEPKIPMKTRAEEDSSRDPNLITLLIARPSRLSAISNFEAEGLLSRTEADFAKL